MVNDCHLPQVAFEDAGEGTVRGDRVCIEYLDVILGVSNANIVPLVSSRNEQAFITGHMHLRKKFKFNAKTFP